MEEGLRKEGRSPLEEVYGGTILGGEEFIQEILKKEEVKGLEDEEISCRRQLKPTRRIEDLIQGVSSYFNVLPSKVLKEKGMHRDIAIYFGKKHTGMTNREIGKNLGGLAIRVSLEFCRGLRRRWSIIES